MASWHQLGCVAAGWAQGPGPEHLGIVASWDAASVLCCFLMCKCLGVLDILASGSECSRCWVHFCTLFSAFFNVFGQGWKLCFVMTLLCTIVIFRVFEWAGPQHLLHCGGFWWILVDFGGFRWMLVDSSGFWLGLVDFGGFWRLSVDFGGFWCFLVDFAGFWWILESVVGPLAPKGENSCRPGDCRSRI